MPIEPRYQPLPTQPMGTMPGAGGHGPARPAQGPPPPPPPPPEAAASAPAGPSPGPGPVPAGAAGGSFEAAGVARWARQAGALAAAAGRRGLQQQSLAMASGVVGGGVAHGGFLLLLSHLGSAGRAAPWALLGVSFGLEAGLTAAARLLLEGRLSSQPELGRRVEGPLWRLMWLMAVASTLQGAALAAASWGLGSAPTPAVLVATATLLARIGEAGAGGMLQALGPERVTELLPTPVLPLPAAARSALAIGESAWRALGANLPALAGLVAARPLGGTAERALAGLIGAVNLGAAVNGLPTLWVLTQLARAGPATATGVAPDDALRAPA